MSGFRIVEHKVPAQHIREYAQGTANTQEDQLYLHVKQYIPLSNLDPQPGDVTILGAHANAFPKELYEPLWEDLITQSQRHGWRIRSIWIADVAHQGMSSALNEASLGNEPSWHDHVRDLLHLVNLKRDQMPRPIVGIGHSMGGNHLTHLSLIHPRLLSSLILLDPVIQPRSAEIDRSPNAPPNLAQLSTFRRDIWPSREQAAASFAKSAFYTPWDPRVLDKWVQFGLRDTPTLLHPTNKAPEVTLATTAAQEVFTYLRPNYDGYGLDGKPVNRATHADLDPARPNQYPFYRNEAPQIYARLAELRPSVLYIFGAISGVSQGPSNDAKVQRTGTGVGGSGGAAEGRVKGVTFEGVGHLIPMEAVGETAAAVGEWVGAEMVRYREEMKTWELWRVKGLREKQEIDERWKEMIGGPPRRPTKL